MKLMILVIGILFLTGCSNYHSFDFNSSSTSTCAVECEDLMREYSCFEARPSYQSSFINGNQTRGACSCYIRSCVK